MEFFRAPSNIWLAVCAGSLQGQLFHRLPCPYRIGQTARTHGLGSVHLSEKRFPGVAIRRGRVDRAHQYVVDEAAAGPREREDERQAVMNHCSRSSLGFAPIVLTGDFLRNALQFQLIVGQALGRSTRHVAPEDVPESQEHTVLRVKKSASAGLLCGAQHHFLNTHRAGRRDATYRLRFIAQIVPVRTVANETQARKGTPARAAPASTCLACLMYSAALATIVVAATVLIPSSRRLKKRRLHPPIISTFHPSQFRARIRDALGAD